MADIFGTSGDDTLRGTTAADLIQGGAGKDRLNGGDGDDTVDGGDGNDYVYGDAGNDKLYGGAGNDAVVGDAGNDELHGGDGNDGMFGGGNDDILFGGAGIDTMYGDGANDTMDGGADDDKLYGGSGNDWLFGGTGNDLLDGGTGNDILVWRSGTGADTFIGNSGIDTIVLDIATADLTDLVKADLVAFDAWLDAQIAAAGGSTASLASATSGPAFSLATLGISVSSVEAFDLRIDGTSVALEDILNAAPVTDAAQALATDENAPVSGMVVATDADGDTLSYTLASGPANGTVSLDAATGQFVYAAANGYSGTDTFTVTVADGNGGTAEQVVNVDIAAVASTPILNVATTIETVTGANVTGTAVPDIIYGTSGDDTINGGAGGDTIYGDAPSLYTFALGIDAALTDTDGSEVLHIEIAGLPADAVLSAGVDLGGGHWQLTAGDLAGLQITVSDAADFTASVTARATEHTGAIAEVVEQFDIRFDRGQGGNDVIDGGTGNDTIVAGVGDDVVQGGDGNDSIAAGAGDDIIAGGAGNDIIDGGTGTDAIDMSGAAVGVVVDLTLGTAIGQGIDVVTNVEDIVGSSFGDVLNGNSEANTISDGGGNDTVTAGGGNDAIVAGSGGSDSYNGGTGNDTVDYSHVASGIDVDLGSGKATGGAGNDKLTSIEGVIGSAFADEISGDKADETLNGGAGKDEIRGGRGADILIGGDGADTFVFTRSDVKSGNTHHGVDTVLDFGAGDRLDFSGILSGKKFADIDDVIHVTETAGGTVVSVDFGGSSGFVNVVTIGGQWDFDLDSLFADGQIIV